MRRTFFRSAWASWTVRHWLEIAAVVALAIGIVARGWALGSIPPGLNQDEAASGYDAFALLTEGIDRTGLRFPVHLPSWGSGMNALAAYLTIPFVAVLGLTSFAIRMPFFLAGVATIVAFHLFLRRVADERTALLGVVVLALNPWHVMVSRWALEANMFPAFFLFAVVAFDAALRTNRAGWGIAGGVLFGLCLYAYGIAYAVVPVFLAIATALALWHSTLRVSTFSWLAGSFAVTAAPIALFMLVNVVGWETIETPLFTIPRLTTAPRFFTASTIDDPGALAGLFGKFGQILVLLGTEDDGRVWNAFPPYGLFGGVGFLLAIVGVAAWCVRSWKKPYGSHVHLFAWLLACGPLVLLSDVNVNRVNILFLPILAFAAIGLSALRKRTVPFATLSLCLVTASSSFLAAYFTEYPERAKGDFVASFHEALAYADANTDRAICVTGDMNMPYIHALFATKTPPSAFASTVEYANPDEEFRAVRRFGRFTFGVHECDPADTGAYVLRKEEPMPQGVSMGDFTAKRYKQFDVYLRRSA